MEVKDVSVRIKRDGWCVVEGVIPASEVGSIRESIVKTVDFHEHSEPDEFGVTNPSRRGLINYDQSLAPYLANKYVMGVTNELWGKWVKITITTPVFNRPGGKPQGWHADWPFNQTNAAHIPAPYGGAPIKLSSLWMLSEFSPHTGGTLVVPGSHRAPINPSGGAAFDREAPHPSELQIAGPAGSVMLFDSRLWHCVATNHSDAPRVAMNIGYAPWWLNLEPTRKGSPEYQAMVVETGGKPNETPLIPAPVFAALPTQVQALVRHWVA